MQLKIQVIALVGMQPLAWWCIKDTSTTPSWKVEIQEHNTVEQKNLQNLDLAPPHELQSQILFTWAI